MGKRECQKICQIKCHEICQIECQKVCQIEWPMKCQRSMLYIYILFANSCVCVWQCDRGNATSYFAGGRDISTSVPLELFAKTLETGNILQQVTTNYLQ